jgi:hypothetical protein
MAGGSQRHKRNERKCKAYKSENREQKNRIKKLKQIIKGFSNPEKFKVVETNDSAYIGVIR